MIFPLFLISIHPVFFLSPFCYSSYLCCVELRVSSYVSGTESIGFHFLLTGKGYLHMASSSIWTWCDWRSFTGERERLDLWHDGLRRTW